MPKTTFKFHLKGVSTRSPLPLLDSISGKKARKDVIRAHEKKTGQKRANRFRAMVKNSKKYFDFDVRFLMVATLV